MRINNLIITSRSALNFEIKAEKPVTILRGKHSGLALDLMREVLGDHNSVCDPDGVDGGHFIIHTDVEMDGKDYSVCYIRNVEAKGDNRIAANFKPDGVEFSRADTMEFLSKSSEKSADSRPAFIYHTEIGDSGNVSAFLAALSGAERQVFIAIPEDYSEIKHENIQNVLIN